LNEITKNVKFIEIEGDKYMEIIRAASEKLPEKKFMFKYYYNSGHIKRILIAYQTKIEYNDNLDEVLILGPLKMTI
jgi:hypothetical protein